MTDQHLDGDRTGERQQAVLLTDMDLPSIFHTSDAESLLGQRRQVRVTATLLALTVAAALSATITVKITAHRIDIGGVLAALAFLLALGCAGYLQRRRPERSWYGGRAIAESARTLAWLYAVGGGLFNVRTCNRPDDELIAKFGLIAERFGLSGLSDPKTDNQITENMRAVRSSSLEERRSAYLAGRIEAQIDWYKRKAAWNARQENAWRGTILALLGIGLGAAVARVAGLLTFNLLGLAAVMVAATVAWLEAKDHGTLAEAYAATEIDLALAKDRAEKITEDFEDSEDAWSQFVERAEHAISREHTLWLARGGARYPIAAR
jgi:SMODS and SLOG-associating 2TM effector domain 3/SMODS and SLOG-associating 2TM effector domain 1